MKIKFLWFFSCLSANLFSQITHQNQPNLHLVANNPERIMTVEINALHNYRADSYIAVLAISQVADAPEKAEKLLRDRTKAFTADLQKTAIQADEVYLDLVSLTPLYKTQFSEAKKKTEAKAIGETLSGFEMRQTIYVRYKDPNILIKILLAAYKYEIYELIRIEHRVQNADEIYKNLRHQCAAYLKEYLRTWEELGVDAADWERTIEESKTVIYPNQRYLEYTAQRVLSNAVVLDGKVQKPVLERSQVPHPNYERLPSEGFEIIQNPDLIEPTVQFVYDFKIHFIVPNAAPKMEFKNEIIMPKTETTSRSNYNNYYTPPVDTSMNK